MNTVLEEDHYIAGCIRTNSGWRQAIKRVVDLVVAAVFLLLMLPVMLLVAVAIRASSRGPVFFRQERIGLNKRRFRIYKFRTMVSDAEKYLNDLEGRNETGGPAFKMKNDPRITPLGKFLRRSSIDELPQLLNVLAGDMSLVGPRPLTVRDYEGFSDVQYQRRFSVKPGITCLYQIGGRSLLSFDQWMLLDLRYIDEWSLWLDLKILVRTIPVVIGGVGAV
jgi:exopolysaccharide biosynthesis polyprenyl glycosylphosphotransferase